MKCTERRKFITNLQKYGTLFRIDFLPIITHRMIVTLAITLSLTWLFDPSYSYLRIPIRNVFDQNFDFTLLIIRLNLQIQAL